MTRKQKEAEDQRVFEAVLERIRKTTREEWIEMINKYETDEPFKLRITMDQIHPAYRKRQQKVHASKEAE